MMCAAHAGPGVLVVDHARAPGEKIRISGGGRCNFTNLHAGPGNFISANPHFCKSALSRYTQWDFIDLVARHGISWHEKTLGQLFCDGKSPQIIAMLRAEMAKAGADLWLQTSVAGVGHDGARFQVQLEREGKRIEVSARHLVVATGGKSIPAMGASGLAYDIAAQFGHVVIDTRPALVPLTFSDKRFAPLSGTAVPRRGPQTGARRLTRRFCSPIVGCQARRFCRFPRIGARARRSRWTLIPKDSCWRRCAISAKCRGANS